MYLSDYLLSNVHYYPPHGVAQILLISWFYSSITIIGPCPFKLLNSYVLSTHIWPPPLPSPLFDIMSRPGNKPNPSSVPLFPVWPLACRAGDWPHELARAGGRLTPGPARHSALVQEPWESIRPPVCTLLTDRARTQIISRQNAFKNVKSQNCI